jgi:hypothetical protein
MQKINPILNIDNSVVKIYDTEKKEPFVQFTNKRKAANVLGMAYGTLNHAVERMSRTTCRRSDHPIAIRLRPHDANLPTDPNLTEYLKILASRGIPAKAISF